MAERTCKPDPELKRLWQRLLPDMPMPACGTPAPPAKADAADARETPRRDGEAD